MIHVGRFLVGGIALLLAVATAYVLAVVAVVLWDGLVALLRDRRWPEPSVLAICAAAAFVVAAYAVGALLIR